MNINTHSVHYPDNSRGPIRERRNAVDYHHAVGVPRDYWHADKPTSIVGHQPDGSLFALYFHSKNLSPLDLSSNLGVALTRCEYGGEGVNVPTIPVRELLRKDILARGPQARLYITWPGYQHLGYGEDVLLDTTIGELASQVAGIFKRFYEKNYQRFEGPGLPLGPDYITYDQIRLRKLFLHGTIWKLELSYVSKDI
ncbi:hypothetical protein DFP72DRAFT_1108668 [Ephemerocybe angulata]|uniref:Uncharacterized protein n=1 Tax=Ephemerocybe angulata TaxID=980116 RepID=A0A8H6LYS6_9AGAR|nr:hypothetical protein DFP72DRAFT_1150317 [Tulosesus angulatus]KAF6765732.1 hypothetical protein DFP72DRAFT_1108668 [Tulosesus angulatus]